MIFSCAQQWLQSSCSWTRCIAKLLLLISVADGVALSVIGWRQSVFVAVTERLAVLQAFPGQGVHLGDASCWPRLCSAESEPDPAQVGVSGADFWPRSSSERTGSIQKGWWWISVSQIWKHFCFILSTDTRIRIDSVMCPLSSSRGRNTSASVTVTVT